MGRPLSPQCAHAPLRIRVSPRSLAPAPAQLLDIAIGDAVQRINRLAFTAGDRPHHYLSILLSPSRSRILLNHTADELEIGDPMGMTHDVRPDALPSRPAGQVDQR
jgi:GntR family transcriptional regulator